MEELIPVVAELADKYTGYESTSITYEKAQQLMNAVIYCIHEYECGSMESAEAGCCAGTEEGTEGDAVRIDGEQGAAGNGNGKTHRSEKAAAAPAAVPKDRPSAAREAYRQGYQLVIRKVKAAQELYNELILGFRDYGSLPYRDTIVHGMPEFFRRYDARFEPQNSPLLLDYPLLVSLDGLDGIDRIYPYLRCVRLEQIFLAGLPEGYPEQVLRNYHEDYEELFLNLPEIILEDMLARSAASGKTADLCGLIDDIVDRAYGGNEELRIYLKKGRQS